MTTFLCLLGVLASLYLVATQPPGIRHAFAVLLLSLNTANVALVGAGVFG